MNKKTAGRISAMAMASMMMMSVCVVNASAEENEPITQLNLKKTVTTDGNTYQPNTSFSFHVENGEAAENWRDNVVYAGVTGGITGTQTIGFQPSGEDTWQQLTARMQHWKLMQGYLNMLVFIIML